MMRPSFRLVSVTVDRLTRQKNDPPVGTATSGAAGRQKSRSGSRSANT